jgi:hypothetical protein
VRSFFLALCWCIQHNVQNVLVHIFILKIIKAHHVFAFELGIFNLAELSQHLQSDVLGISQELLIVLFVFKPGILILCIIGLPDIGIFRAFLSNMSEVFTAHALNLPLASCIIIFVLVIVLPGGVLLEQASRRIDIPFSAAPPHVVSVLASVDLATPIEVLLLIEVLLAIEAKLGVHVDDFSVL